MGKKWAGLQPRGNSIRIHAKIDGRLHSKTLNLAPTTANLDHAAKLRAAWIAELKGNAAPDEMTFGVLAKQWIDAQDHLAKSTLLGYRKLLNQHWMPVLWAQPIRSITSLQIKQIVAGTQWSSGKTRNNAVSVLKAVFEQAYLDDLIERNPAAKIRRAPHEPPEPDPFTLDEIDALLPHIERREPAYRNFYEFAFFTGLRTSELLALRWDRVDWRSRTVRVDSAYVRSETKGTKTNRRRDVELHDRALAALQRQKAHTFLAGGLVFVNPRAGGQICDDKPPRLVWDAAMQASGLRRRYPYQTRHTYASMALMAGCNPMWVARQLGHTTMAMTLKRYGRWIAGADQGGELAKMTAGAIDEQVCSKH